MPKVVDDVKLDFCDVLLQPKASNLSSRNLVKLTDYRYGTEIVPIIAANMDGVGTFSMARSLSNYCMLTALIKHYTLEELVSFFKSDPVTAKYTIYSMGSSDAEMRKFLEFNRMIDAGEFTSPFAVCIDVANGYTNQFADFVENVTLHSRIPVFAGNVVTPEAVYRLLRAGATAVKVGIGPGSVCTTRKKAGVGYPQLSAVLECADAAKSLNASIISDGGCTCPGDVAKAFAAGADYVMLGGMLAGHTEGGGDFVLKDGKEYCLFYGMSSKEAQEKYNGGVAEYRASEGKEVLVDFRGPVVETIKDILGGVRSACTYVGAERLELLSPNATFVRVNRILNNIFSSE